MGSTDAAGGEQPTPAGGELADALATKDRLEAILHNAMDAIITIDARHEIIFFNPAAEKMFGITSAEARGQKIERFVPERFRASHDQHIDQFGQTGQTGRRMGALGKVSGVRADGQEFPLEASISQAVVAGERLSTVILRDITERLANEEVRVLLAREVDHRAKNALAVVQALVALTRATTRDDFVGAIEGRIAAIARAHSLLARNEWHGGDLAQVIGDELVAYSRPNQIRCEGPTVLLLPRAVQPIGLLIHELATNAVKYGALSTVEGRVTVSWSTDEEGGVTLGWRERGGPHVTPPVQRGFGSTLISTVTAQQLGGTVDVLYAPEGLEVEARLPGSVVQSTSGQRHATLNAVAPFDGHNPAQARRSVLIVEDEVLIGLQLADALSEAGWRVVGPATSIEEASGLVEANGAPDVALLDVNLNGQHVGPLARVLGDRGVPILLCTGYERIEDQRLQGYPLVRKPANVRQLVSAMDGAIAQALGA